MPNVKTLETLKSMIADESMHTVYMFVLSRLNDYRVGLSDCGKCICQDEIMTDNHVKCLLRVDTQNKFEDLSKGIVKHVVNHAFREAVRIAKHRMVLAPDGTREDKE